jgi:Cys-rich four helix bundle protein (predicted Tat secretion target)
MAKPKSTFISETTSRAGTRRTMMLAAVSAAATGFGLALIDPAFAQQTPKGSKAPAKARPVAPAGPNQQLVDAAKRCGRVGQICLAHCIRLTRAGDKSLADCMQAVRAMLPVCAAIGQLAAQDAKRLKDMARLCVSVCSDCEDECRKHEFHHVECKNCAEACAAMITACKAVLGA